MRRINPFPAFSFLLVLVLMLCGITASRAASAPAIRILGIDNNIINTGDTTPSIFDGTDFGAVPLGGDPVRKVFVIQNTGNAPLSIAGIQLDNGPFAVSIAPPTQLAAGGIGSFEVTYTPVSAGLQSSTARISSNDTTKNPYTFAIQGRATAPVVHVTGNGINIPATGGTASTAAGTDFGNVTVGTDSIRQFTLSNDGDADLTISGFSSDQATGFALVGTLPQIIPANTSATFQIRFTPTQERTYATKTTGTTGVFSISTNAPAAPLILLPLQGVGVVPEIEVTGNGVSIPSGTITPAQANGTLLGDVSLKVGELSSSFTISNKGTGILLLGDITLSNTTSFRTEITPAGATQVAPGASVALKVIFAPIAGGVSNTTVTIHSNDTDESNFSFVVSGNGLAAGMDFGGITNGDTTPSTDDGTAFGNGIIGSGVTHEFPISNAGPGTLVITSVSIFPNTVFKFTGQLPLTIPAGQTMKLPIVFTPTTMGLQTAVVTVRTNDPARDPFVFTISGYGTNRSLAVGTSANPIANGDTTPDSADGTLLSNAMVGGSSVTASFPMRNVGNIPLQISSIVSSNSSEFSVTSTNTVEIAAGGSSTLSVRFLPNAVGLRNTTITITSNDPLSPFTFKIAGTGTPRISEPSDPADPPILTPVDWNPNISGDFSGSFYETDAQGNPTNVVRGGFDSFHVNPNGTFTAKGNIDGVPVVLKGKLGPDGTYHGVAQLPDGSAAVIDIKTYTGSDGSVHIIGTLVRNGETLYIDLVRSTGTSLPMSMTGCYTMLIPAQDNAPQGEPHGDGIAALTVRIDGTVRSQFVLGDGTLTTRSSKITPRYVWQFNFPVYGGWRSGYLAGHMNFRDVPQVSDFDGDIFWKRAANPKASYYPSGFAVSRKAVGAKYLAPAKGYSAMPGLAFGLQNAEMRLGSSGEGVPSAALPLSWSIADKVTGPTGAGTTKLSLNVNRRSGMISGLYVDPVSHSRVTVYSAILQKQKLAGGLFKGYRITGFVTMTPAGTN